MSYFFQYSAVKELEIFDLLVLLFCHFLVCFVPFLLLYEVVLLGL